MSQILYWSSTASTVTSVEFAAPELSSLSSSAHPETTKMELNKNRMMIFFMGKAPTLVFLNQLKHHLGCLIYPTLSRTGNIGVSVESATKHVGCN